MKNRKNLQVRKGFYFLKDKVIYLDSQTAGEDDLILPAPIDYYDFSSVKDEESLEVHLLGEVVLLIKDSAGGELPKTENSRRQFRCLADSNMDSIQLENSKGKKCKWPDSFDHEKIDLEQTIFLVETDQKFKNVYYIWTLPNLQEVPKYDLQSVKYPNQLAFFQQGNSHYLFANNRQISIEKFLEKTGNDFVFSVGKDLSQHTDEEAAFLLGLNYKMEIPGPDEIKLLEERLPLDTATVLSESDKGVSNFHLKLHKFAKFHKSGDSYTFASSLVHEFDGWSSFGFPNDIDAISWINKRTEKQAETLFKSGHICQLQNVPLDGRLIVGLGNASVYETGMTLHHIYGVPYIPASTVKGILRSWVIQNCFLPKVAQEEEKRGEKAEELAMKNNLFAFIFGSDDKAKDGNAKQGKVGFFDVFPNHPPVIEADIMNVHYKPYYGNREPPGDYHNPVPVLFLTVGSKSSEGQDQNYTFHFGTKDNIRVDSRNPKTEEFFFPNQGDICIIDESIDVTLKGEESILMIVKQWLNSALVHHGIGAKTSVGYGSFKKTDNGKTTQ